MESRPAYMGDAFLRRVDHDGLAGAHEWDFEVDWPGHGVTFTKQSLITGLYNPEFAGYEAQAPSCAPRVSRGMTLMRAVSDLTRECEGIPGRFFFFFSRTRRRHPRCRRVYAWIWTNAAKNNVRVTRGARMAFDTTSFSRRAVFQSAAAGAGIGATRLIGGEARAADAGSVHSGGRRQSRQRMC